MNIKKIYTGFTKDGKDKLLLKVKKYISLNKFYIVYIDLETNKVYSENEVDLESLVPFENISNQKRFMRKRKVIETYRLDREQIIKIEDLIFGDICRVRNRFEDDFALSSNRIIYLNNYIKERKDCLFITKWSKNGSVYNELLTNMDYEKYVLGIEDGSLFVNIDTLNFDFDMCDIEMSKKLILEKHYRKERLY